VSSGNRIIYRLSRRGNRQLNHAIQMAAVTQIRQRHSDGRACFDKKLAEGKTRKEALRALNRRISDAIFACLRADARRGAARAKGPGGQTGNDSVASAAGSHPDTGSSAKPLPGLRPPYGPGPHPAAPRQDHQQAAPVRTSLNGPASTGHSRRPPPHLFPFPRLLPISPGDEPHVKMERPERSEDERP
jgi:hypothetical protein